MGFGFYTKITRHTTTTHHNPPPKTQCRQYLSCYLPDFNKTLKLGSWDHKKFAPKNSTKKNVAKRKCTEKNFRKIKFFPKKMSLEKNFAGKKNFPKKIILPKKNLP